MPEAVAHDLADLLLGNSPAGASAGGMELLMILKYPPPASFLNFTRLKSGSTPVVSQSMTRPIVPVGAMAVTWALR